MQEENPRQKAAMHVLLHLLVPMALAIVIFFALLKVQFLSRLRPETIFPVVFAVVFYLYSLWVWGKKHNALFYISTVAVFGISGYIVADGVWWGILVGCVIWLVLSLILGYMAKGFRSLVSNKSWKSKRTVSQGDFHDSAPSIHARSGEVDILAEFQDPGDSSKRIVIDTGDLYDAKLLTNKLKLVEQMILQSRLTADNLAAVGNLVEKNLITSEQFQRWLGNKFPEMAQSIAETKAKRSRKIATDFMVPL